MTESPRNKARRHLEKLSRGAALAVTAAIGPTVGACDIEPAPPPPEQCTSDDDPEIRVNVGATLLATGEVQLELALNTFSFSDILLDDRIVVVSGGALVSVEPARPSTSTFVTVVIAPEADAVEIAVETALTCQGDAKDVRLTIALANGAPTGPVTVQEVL